MSRCWLAQSTRSASCSARSLLALESRTYFSSLLRSAGSARCGGGTEVPWARESPSVTYQERTAWTCRSRLSPYPPAIPSRSPLAAIAFSAAIDCPARNTLAAPATRRAALSGFTRLADRSARDCRNASSSRWAAAAATCPARPGAPGQVLRERVVEPVPGGGRALPGASGLARITGTGAAAQQVRRHRDVVRGAGIGGGDALPQRGRRAARPEHQADPEAHGEADRDVLDPDEPDLPADGLNEVEEHDQDDGERGLARRERDHPRGVRGDQHGNREYAPQDRVAGADGQQEGRADHDPGGCPGERAQHRPAGAECIGAQDRQRAEDDPEGMLEAGSLRDEHGDR